MLWSCRSNGWRWRASGMGFSITKQTSGHTVGILLLSVRLHAWCQWRVWQRRSFQFLTINEVQNSCRAKFSQIILKRLSVKLNKNCNGSVIRNGIETLTVCSVPAVMNFYALRFVSWRVSACACLAGPSLGAGSVDGSEWDKKRLVDSRVRSRAITPPQAVGLSNARSQMHLGSQTRGLGLYRRIHQGASVWRLELEKPSIHLHVHLTLPQGRS